MDRFFDMSGGCSQWFHTTERLRVSLLRQNNIIKRLGQKFGKYKGLNSCSLLDSKDKKAYTNGQSLNQNKLKKNNGPVTV